MKSPNKLNAMIADNKAGKTNHLGQRLVDLGETLLIISERCLTIGSSVDLVMYYKTKSVSTIENYNFFLAIKNVAFVRNSSRLCSF